MKAQKMCAYAGLTPKAFKVREKDLTGWVCALRERGYGAFFRRPTAPPRAAIRTPAAVKEAFRRESLVKKFFRMKKEGYSLKKTARKLQVPLCQLHRWCEAYVAEGFPALLPRGRGFGPKTKRFGG